MKKKTKPTPAAKPATDPAAISPEEAWREAAKLFGDADGVAGIMAEVEGITRDFFGYRKPQVILAAALVHMVNLSRDERAKAIDEMEDWVELGRDGARLDYTFALAGGRGVVTFRRHATAFYGSANKEYCAEESAMNGSGAIWISPDVPEADIVRVKRLALAKWLRTYNLERIHRKASDYLRNLLKTGGTYGEEY